MATEEKILYRKQRLKNEVDSYFTPEMIAKIKRSMQEAKDGKVTRVGSIEELHAFFDGL